MRLTYSTWSVVMYHLHIIIQHPTSNITATHNSRILLHFSALCLLLYAVVHPSGLVDVFILLLLLGQDFSGGLKVSPTSRIGSAHDAVHA